MLYDSNTSLSKRLLVCLGEVHTERVHRIHMRHNVSIFDFTKKIGTDLTKLNVVFMRNDMILLQNQIGPSFAFHCFVAHCTIFFCNA